MRVLLERKKWLNGTPSLLAWAPTGAQEMRDEKLPEKWDGARRRSELQHLPSLDETAERTVESVGRDAQKPAAATRGGAMDLQAVWDRRINRLEPI